MRCRAIFAISHAALLPAWQPYIPGWSLCFVFVVFECCIALLTWVVVHPGSAGPRLYRETLAPVPELLKPQLEAKGKRGKLKLSKAAAAARNAPPAAGGWEVVGAGAEELQALGESLQHSKKRSDIRLAKAVSLLKRL